jgi:acyl-coenzyme A thioesterase PaaI-like protein
MSIPANFINLRASLDDLAPISRQTHGGGLDKNEGKFNHQFSKREGLKLLSVKPGHVEAEIQTKDDQVNAHGSIHGGLLTTSTDAVMAATAQSSLSQKDGKLIAVVRDFAQRFLKPIFPGDKLTIVSNLTSSEANDRKNIKYISSEIRKGQEVVGQAISSYFIVDKNQYLQQAA